MSYDSPTDGEIQCEIEARGEEMAGHEGCREVGGCSPECPWCAYDCAIRDDPDVVLMPRVPSAECSCGWWSTGLYMLPDAIERVTKAGLEHMRQRGLDHAVCVVQRSEIVDLSPGNAA